MVPPQTGSLAQRAIEEWERNLCENKPSQFWNGCRLAEQPARKTERNAHCHRVGPALSGSKSFNGSPNAFIQACNDLAKAMKALDGAQCLHPSHHQNHARQAEPPSHCANDHLRSRRGPYTLRESSQLLRGPQSPRRSNTPHCAAKHTIPVNACGQREVLTVVTHQHNRCYGST